jgi:hypothetical protein
MKNDKNSRTAIATAGRAEEHWSFPWYTKRRPIIQIQRRSERQKSNAGENPENDSLENVLRLLYLVSIAQRFSILV